ncbi:hypothetical protein C0992_008038 [Termitomyces sp. T32_za158]|nr:hypothetical protein C0992_008038 [Termitomyces sp. T32_za158]
MPPPKGARPQVIITTTPPKPAASSPQPAPSPPDFYGMFKRAVKRDSNQVILAVLQRPMFAQAAIGLCGTAKAFPGTPADRARYLGTIGWRFADQADFPVLADQRGLFDALSATLPLVDRQAADDSSDVKAFFTFADAIIQIEGSRREAQRQRDLEEKRRCEREDRDVEMLGPSTACPPKRKANTDPEGKPKPKKVKITPSVAGYKTGGDLALTLLGQIDATLEAVSLADGDGKTPREELQKQRDAVELAAQQHLHFLDTTLQTYKLIVARLSRLDKALAASDVDHTGSLLDALNVSFESTPEDSDVEFADPPEDSSDSTVLEVPTATEV